MNGRSFGLWLPTVNETVVLRVCVSLEVAFHSVWIPGNDSKFLHWCVCDCAFVPKELLVLCFVTGSLPDWPVVY